ncbi:MAG: hypothetical protein MHMPM18_002000 [Marteilia pararefringens]
MIIIDVTKKLFDKSEQLRRELIKLLSATQRFGPVELIIIAANPGNKRQKNFPIEQNGLIGDF